MNDEQMQEITMTIYPEYEGPLEWRLQAYVYGEWAAHEVPLSDRWLRSKGFTWAVSHIPTGAIGYVGSEKEIITKAARRLSQLEPPGAHVITDEDEEPRMSPPPDEWIRTSNEMLKDLDVLACVGGKLIKPEDVYRQRLIAQAIREKARRLRGTP